jgi:hypothetical protein
MCFSFGCEAAEMVASMATTQNRFASRSKVCRPFAAEHAVILPAVFAFSQKRSKITRSRLLIALDANGFTRRP